MPGRGRGASARMARQVRDALAALLDQRTPFGRLALTHVILTAGDALVAISLAGSLFFTISPSAAKGRVILYLLLTMAPFAVVAPLLGPVIDRSRGARRAVVVLSAACRAAVCLVMAGDLGSLLVFPEAFAMLVLSKTYLVTKGSLVPLVVGPLRPGGAGGEDPEPASGADEHQLATANARLGLLASLAGFAAALPAVVVFELFGAPWVLRLDIVVFAAGTVAAARLPIRTSLRGRWGDEPLTRRDATPLGALGPRVNTHPEVLLALSAMSIVRGLVGFLTFFLAFALRLSHVSNVKLWLGALLAASTAGALVGVMAVPRVRRMLVEPQMLTSCVGLVAVAGAVAALVGGVVIQVLLAFVIGAASAASKPAFDALVQRYVPTAAQGRAFARFETRLQLMWVLGALLAVVVNLALGAGDVVIAVVAAVAGVSYLGARRALPHGSPAAGSGVSSAGGPGRRAARRAPPATGRRIGGSGRE